MFFFFCLHYPGGLYTPGGRTKNTPHIKMDRVYKQQVQMARRGEKEEEEEVEVEEEEEENTWGCLARPKRLKGPAEPAKKKERHGISVPGCFCAPLLSVFIVGAPVPKEYA